MVKTKPPRVYGDDERDLACYPFQSAPLISPLAAAHHAGYKLALDGLYRTVADQRDAGDG